MPSLYSTIVSQYGQMDLCCGSIETALWNLVDWHRELFSHIYCQIPHTRLLCRSVIDKDKWNTHIDRPYSRFPEPRAIICQEQDVCLQREHESEVSYSSSSHRYSGHFAVCVADIVNHILTQFFDFTSDLFGQFLQCSSRR